MNLVCQHQDSMLCIGIAARDFQRRNVRFDFRICVGKNALTRAIGTFRINGARTRKRSHNRSGARQCGNTPDA